jgi:hypothetical protein
MLMKASNATAKTAEFRCEYRTGPSRDEPHDEQYSAESGYWKLQFAQTGIGEKYCAPTQLKVQSSAGVWVGIYGRVSGLGRFG